MRHSTILAGSLLILFPLAGRAQVEQRVEAPVSRRWTFAMHLGGFGGGPGDDIVTALRSAGYTGSPGPDKGSHTGPLQLSLRRRGEWLTLELQLSQATTGYAIGNSAANDFLLLDHAGTVLAMIGSVARGPLRVGAGPAVLRGAWDWHQMNGGDESWSSTSAGVVGGAGLAIPMGRSFLLEGSGQLRRFGKVTVPSPGVGARPVQPFQADVSHWYIGAGIGIRL